MPPVLKKTIISLLIVVQLFIFTVGNLATPVNAQGTKSLFGNQPWHNQSLGQFYTKVHDKNNPAEIFGERYTWAQVDWIIWSVIMWPWTQLLGSQIFMCVFTLDTSECVESVFDPIINAFTLNDVQDQNQSLASAMFKDRPISAVTYAKDIGRKLNLIPEAQAQGFGYNYALDPIRDMWRVSRNAMYALFVIITIIMAFLIMFRMKTSPQTVITVQSALPKLFITLILVTFSYAIAGLLIDLMYVVIGIVSWLGSQYYPGEPWQPEVVTIFNWITAGPFGLGFVAILFIYLFAFTSMGFITLGIYGGVAGFTPFAPGVAFLKLIYLLFIIIILLAIIIAGIKTAWMLIKSYVMILILTIFAPFIIGFGALSNSGSIGFSSWVKKMVENLATFVVAGALYLFSFIFLFWSVGMAIGQYITLGLDVPGILTAIGQLFLGTRFIDTIGPEPSDYWPPLLTGGNESYVMMLFLFTSAVIFLVIPSTTKMIRSAITGQPFMMGTAIGEAVGPVRMAGSAGVTGGATALKESLFTAGGRGAGWSDTRQEFVKGILDAVAKRGI